MTHLFFVQNAHGYSDLDFWFAKSELLIYDFIYKILNYRKKKYLTVIEMHGAKFSALYEKLKGNFS